MEPQAGPFHVYAFQAAELDDDGNPEDVILASISASHERSRLPQNAAEITLEPLKVKLPASVASSDKGEYRAVYRYRADRPRHLPKDCRAREAAFPASIPPISRSRWTSVRITRSAPIAIYSDLEKRKGAAR